MTNFFRLLCHLAYGHFTCGNRLIAKKFCFKLPISLGQMSQNLFHHLSHFAYPTDGNLFTLGWLG
jgi:hypothetical protein